MHSKLGWSRWSVVVRPWTWTGVVGAMLGTGWTQLGQMGLAGCGGEKGMVSAGTVG